MDKRYIAALSRSQGRNAFAAIFRHPVRTDPYTRKPLRVRQGLGTGDEVEAQKLVDDLNQLLEDSTFWNWSARSLAEKRFARRVVEIFYYGMEPEAVDFGLVRDGVIELPNSSITTYRSALLMGTTGSGKTTLLRQILGTNPAAERFPSTSTGKTTVHETEVLLDDGSFRVAVTFFPIDEVREHLNECISDAVLAAYRDESDAEVLRKLLMHVNQRFRFNYILGNGALAVGDADDDDEDDPEEEFNALEFTTDDRVVDLDATNVLLEKSVLTIRTVAKQHGSLLKLELGAADERDQRVVDELFEEGLDRALREDEAFHRLGDDLMDEIELRFSLLDGQGSVERSKQGWPQCWSWETDDRSDFVKTVTRFSGNQASQFGSLLTPLVNGVRIAGPFVPTWNSEVQPKLVLLDGEGLGHTPKSLASISTSLAKRIQRTDAVVLVDNATQPMQAAPVAAMKEMISSGAASKLLLAFTHFDRVSGDNIPNASAREQHVLASAENVLATIGEELGPFAERALRGRLKEGCFFLGSIDKMLDPAKKTQRRTIDQLRGLLSAIDAIVERPAPVHAKPVYSRMNLALAVKGSAEAFHDIWWPRLGLASKPGISKENWKRIWALTRRLQTPGWEDYYSDLMPVADLRTQLKTQLYVLLQNPVRWEPSEPAEDSEKLQMFDSLAEVLSAQIQDLATRRVRSERMEEWQAAFNQWGKGSSYTRASIIGQRIYDRAAPVPDVVASPDRNSFLNDVAVMLQAVCKTVGAQLE